jgi:transcription antitermination factor NusG
MERTASSDSLAGRTAAVEFPDLRPAPAFSTGQRVRVKSGQLAGLEGNVVKLDTDGQCLVELRDLGPGILAIVHPRQLVRV